MAKILLVEDDEKIRKMMSLRLQLKGHTIESAVNGKEGFEKALSADYDAVLMDMHMPVMDGHEATKNLREAGYKGLIIAVTASVMSKDTQSAINAGCDRFIAKPVPEDFEEQLGAIIQAFQQT